MVCIVGFFFLFLFFKSFYLLALSMVQTLPRESGSRHGSYEEELRVQMDWFDMDS